MAAPAGGGGSAVSVLAPNGRRHTVKVTPSTVLLQVLEDTCQRQNFNPSEYDLKFQRNVLDLSLQWRFANLPNNAKLEMVPVSRSREGPENMVRIALQLDDGSRLQDTFCSGQTLWELLNHFAQTRECLEQPSEASPVCVYMRDEVTGRASLQSTTLKSLGLTGGSAIIRFAMKRRNQEPGVSRTKTPGSPAPSLSADQATGGPLLPLNSVGLSQGDVSHQDEVGTSGASRVDAPAKQISKEPAPAPFVPFSGGGQRLGGSSGSARSLTSPSAKPPKSFSSPGGPSKPKKSRPGQEPGSEPEPADLFPAALVHFGAEEPTGLFLEPRLLERTVSPSAADLLVARCMPRAAGAPPPMPAPDPAPRDLEPTAEAGAVGLPESRPETAQPVKRDLGKVPKWLKLPERDPTAPCLQLPTLGSSILQPVWTRVDLGDAACRDLTLVNRGTDRCPP
ncbi:tether containing UBX domain for GLUT4 isoform X5 [Prionailurus viverrinus]|uniref:tether containing UBX domain for GLUT4 isoform X5 n=1 Tax=Prionailurus viverrinus TaxID=61388 RepID=UPI001FF2A7EF|nr:tether containing UBX domain for GLUT4 isoform X5 [Prionailurus viverrinus]